MIFNPEMFGILSGISAGTWLLVNRVFLKAGVKRLVKEIHSRLLSGYSLETITNRAVQISVLFVAFSLVVLSNQMTLQAVIEEIPDLKYASGLVGASFLKCFVDIEPADYSPFVGFIDLILTVTFIYSGSKVIHRLEKYFGYKYDDGTGMKSI